MPADASCEDIDVDPGLGFLTNFVSNALANGAVPYISEADRLDMGVVRTSAPAATAAAADSSHALRFAAYERAAAPQAVQTVSVVNRDISPVRGELFALSVCVLISCRQMPVGVPSRMRVWGLEPDLAGCLSLEYFHSTSRNPDKPATD